MLLYNPRIPSYIYNEKDIKNHHHVPVYYKKNCLFGRLDVMKNREESVLCFVSIFSVYKEHWIPRWDLNIKPINWSTTNRPRRQDVDEKYVENGAFYITTKEQFLNSGIRYGGRIGVVEMPMQRSFQVDTYKDLDIIKKLF